MKLKNKYYRLQGRTELYTDLWYLYRSIGFINEYTYFRNNNLYLPGQTLNHQEHIEKALDKDIIGHRCRIFRQRDNVVKIYNQYAQLNMIAPIIVEEVYLEPVVIKSVDIKLLGQ